MKNQKTSRRSFLKAGLIVGGAMPIVAGLSQNAQADEPTQALDPKNPQAAALGYVHDGSKVDVEKWTKKAGEAGAKQKCSNCALYLKGGLKAEGKEGDWGKCAIFPTALVSAEGWCNSWAPKAS